MSLRGLHNNQGAKSFARPCRGKCDADFFSRYFFRAARGMPFRFAEGDARVVDGRRPTAHGPRCSAVAAYYYSQFPSPTSAALAAAAA